MTWDWGGIMTTEVRRYTDYGRRAWGGIMTTDVGRYNNLGVGRYNDYGGGAVY